MTKPHVCPVCQGKRTVSPLLYEGYGTAAAGDVPCRTCGGSGIVWEPKP